MKRNSKTEHEYLVIVWRERVAIWFSLVRRAAESFLGSDRIVQVSHVQVQVSVLAIQTEEGHLR